MHSTRAHTLASETPLGEYSKYGLLHVTARQQTGGRSGANCATNNTNLLEPQRMLLAPATPAPCTPANARRGRSAVEDPNVGHRKVGKTFKRLQASSTTKSVIPVSGFGENRSNPIIAPFQHNQSAHPIGTQRGKRREVDHDMSNKHDCLRSIASLGHASKKSGDEVYTVAKSNNAQA